MSARRPSTPTPERTGVDLPSAEAIAAMQRPPAPAPPAPAPETAPRSVPDRVDPTRHPMQGVLDRLQEREDELAELRRPIKRQVFTPVHFQAYPEQLQELRERLVDLREELGFPVRESELLRVAMGVLPAVIPHFTTAIRLGRRAARIPKRRPATHDRERWAAYQRFLEVTFRSALASYVQSVKDAEREAEFGRQRAIEQEREQQQQRQEQEHQP